MDLEYRNNQRRKYKSTASIARGRNTKKDMEDRCTSSEFGNPEVDDVVDLRVGSEANVALLV